MDGNDGEPVEISTRMRPGEWTQESLTELLGSYQAKLRAMGAAEAEIETFVETPDDGSAKVKVSWRHLGVQTFADMAQNALPESDNSRGHGEAIPAGDATQDSKGLGAFLGDAERSAIDEPPSRRALDAENQLPDPGIVVITTDDGRTYVEDEELSAD